MYVCQYLRLDASEYVCVLVQMSVYDLTGQMAGNWPASS